MNAHANGFIPTLSAPCIYIGRVIIQMTPMLDACLFFPSVLESSLQQISCCKLPLRRQGSLITRN